MPKNIRGYFNARVFYKNELSMGTETKESIKNYFNLSTPFSWVLRIHGSGINYYGRIVGNELYFSELYWESKTKPKPLTEKEIKKYRGE